MNTVVVLAGLMLVVPLGTSDQRLDGLTVLVLETGNACGQYEQPMPHEAKIFTLNAGRKHDLQGEWSFEAPGTDRIELVYETRMLRLEEVYKYVENQEFPPVKPDCLTGEVGQQCWCNGKPLVKARLKFTGNWIVRPIEIDADRLPRADVVDDSTWGFVQGSPRRDADGHGGHTGPLVTPHQMQIAGGLVLEPRLEGQVKIDAPPGLDPYFRYPLPTLADCMSAVGIAGECSIVEVQNTSIPNRPNYDHSEIDFHHHLLYELFSEPSKLEPRYLMYLRKDGQLERMAELGFYGGGGGSPGVRPCSGTMVAPPQPPDGGSP